MRYVPPGIYRRRASSDRPPTWYDVWYCGPESGDVPVLLGKSERQRRHMEQKMYPSDGSWPRVWSGWVAGAEWLMDCWRGAKARSDATRTTEDEEVSEA